MTEQHGAALGDLLPTDGGTATPGPVTVFYDGACPLCAAEIGHYRRRRGAGRLAWVDVATCAADRLPPGLTVAEAQRRFHVRDGGGRVVSGGRAFAVLWEALPGYAWIGRLFRLRPAAWVLDRGYDSFLRVRPRLQSLARRLTARRR